MPIRLNSLIHLLSKMAFSFLLLCCWCYTSHLVQIVSNCQLTRIAGKFHVRANKVVGTHIVANRPRMAGTVSEFWALSRCPGGIQVVPEFTSTLRFGFHLLRWPPQSQSCLYSLVLFDTHKATKAVRRHFLAEKNFRPTILAPACVPTTLFARMWKFSTMRVSW